MLKLKSIQQAIAEAYIITVISILGIVAFTSAILIAWPALAYLGSKIIA